MPGLSAADQEEILEESRNEIHVIEVEYINKREDLERKQRQRKQAEAELQRRRNRQFELDQELNALSRHALKHSGDDDDKKNAVDQARRDFTEDAVGEVLRGRVPLMEIASASAEEEADAARAVAKEHKAETDEHNPVVHDTVLVSYAAMSGDDYQVAYRIDKSTTVDELHRDACSYWGCSHNDFVLCKTTQNEEAKSLWEKDDPEAISKRQRKLQNEADENAALDSSENAQLHLVNWKDLESFQTMRKKLKEQEPKILQEMQATGKANEASTIKTFKHGGHGFASNDVLLEPHIEALRGWPGLYQMLKQHRSKAQRDEKWKRISCADILALLALICFSVATNALRSQHGSFELRSGVVQTLDNAAGWESTLGNSNSSVNGTGATPLKFHDIGMYDDIWIWFERVFVEGVYNESSLLRRFYQPVGYWRLRQQIANETLCAAGRVLPPDLRRPCYYIYVNDATQEKADKTFAPSAAVTSFTDASPVRAATPDPFLWQPADKDSFALYGYMQHRYEGSGYSIVYDHSAAAADQVKQDLAFIRESWVVPQTRMLVAELTLANYNYGGYVSANFMLEISPSGAVKPNLDVKGFTLFASWQADVAEGFDVVRWIITIGYMFLWRLFARSKAKAQAGKSRFTYILSAGGLADIVVCGLFIASQVYTYKDSPPKPEDLQVFHSFLSYAHDQEIISILDAVFVLVCVLRLASFARLAPLVYRLFKVFRRSIKPVVYFTVMLVCVITGFSGLAHSIWSAKIVSFSTFTLAVVSVVVAIYQPFADIQDMYKHGSGWTLPFLIYFVLCVSLFMMHMYLAIIVYSYWEVELLETDSKAGRAWSIDQWADWALWPPVYKKLTGRQPGSSRKAGEAAAEEESSDSESDSDGEG